MQITTVGLDLAKRIFQVHAVEASGEIVMRKALRRSQVLTFFTLVQIIDQHVAVSNVTELLRLGNFMNIMAGRRSHVP